MISLLFLIAWFTICPLGYGLTPNGGQVWDGNGWLFLVDNPDAQRPYPPKSDSWKSWETTIFIGISSFRDRRCPATLFNYFSKAEYPERIRIGVVQQNNADEDPDCLERYCELMKKDGRWADLSEECPFQENIQVIRLDYKLANGPCFGRHFQSYLLGDEEFCMQSDSHMDVVEHWDTRMLNAWGLANNEYGVLTAYVHRISQLGTRGIVNNQEVPHLCQLYFTEGNHPRFVQAKLARHLPVPKLTTGWAAGYNFSKCHGWKAVPYDPHLKQVFDGEEFSMAARLWTRGYDFYTPNESLIGHDYNKVSTGPGPHSWTKNTVVGQRKASYERLAGLLGTTEEARADPPDMGKYGLGTARSIEQLQHFIGVDLTSLETTGSRCGSLNWVPFQESWPPTEDNIDIADKDQLLNEAKHAVRLEIDFNREDERPEEDVNREEIGPEADLNQKGSISNQETQTTEAAEVGSRAIQASGRLDRGSECLPDILLLIHSSLLLSTADLFWLIGSCAAMLFLAKHQKRKGGEEREV
ncbi:unnamed protein product [Chrysoparadoxa australica]